MALFKFNDNIRNYNQGILKLLNHKIKVDINTENLTDEELNTVIEWFDDINKRKISNFRHYDDLVFTFEPYKFEKYDIEALTRILRFSTANDIDLLTFTIARVLTTKTKCQIKKQNETNYFYYNNIIIDNQIQFQFVEFNDEIFNDLKLILDGYAVDYHPNIPLLIDNKNLRVMKFDGETLKNFDDENEDAKNIEDGDDKVDVLVLLSDKLNVKKTLMNESNIELIEHIKPKFVIVPDNLTIPTRFKRCEVYHYTTNDKPYDKTLKSLNFLDDRDSIEDEEFKNCKLISIDIPTTVEYIGARAFKNCKHLTHVSIPDTITEITEGAFEGCENLRKIELPDTIEKIEDNAFSDCGLTEINFPTSLTYIGQYAFLECKFENLTIPTHIRNLGYESFYRCRNLKHVKILGDSIYRESFKECFDFKLETPNVSLLLHSYANDVENFIVPNSVKCIDSECFKYCYKLKHIKIPDSVKEIEDRAFRSCINLKEIVIPNGIKTIKEYTFDECSSLTCVSLPTTLTSIGKGAFSECGSLRHINIPDSVKFIDISAFNYCHNLDKQTKQKIESLTK